MIHSLGFDSYGVEILPRWAAARPRTVCADARALPFADDTFDSVATSPVYPTGMTDAFTARDRSYRLTYMPPLRRAHRRTQPTESPERPRREQRPSRRRRPYWPLSGRAWLEVTRVLRPGGLFVLNVKNHTGVARKCSWSSVTSGPSKRSATRSRMPSSSRRPDTAEQAATALYVPRGEWVLRLRAPEKEVSRYASASLVPV
jgi:hypothetical protein